jgi:hypothetical protein
MAATDFIARTFIPTIIQYGTLIVIVGFMAVGFIGAITIITGLTGAMDTATSTTGKTATEIMTSDMSVGKTGADMVITALIIGDHLAKEEPAGPKIPAGVLASPVAPTAPPVGHTVKIRGRTGTGLRITPVFQSMTAEWLSSAEATANTGPPGSNLWVPRLLI